MERNEIVQFRDATELADSMAMFDNYLQNFGLPSTNIIASNKERVRIMNALPDFLDELDDDVKKDATYLSKFVAGAAIGLFDASLNFVWNEVVVNLRKKVVCYGLELFYDNAVDLKRRPFYKDEHDLSGIKDKTLLDTCWKLELIQDIVYKKLCHILDMRNQIGASHPTSYNINAYELMGWLETCINEVLNEKPSNSAITAKSIIDNLKKMQDAVNEISLRTFSEKIADMSHNMVDNLLISLFGIFTSEDSNPILLQNVMRVGEKVWAQASDDVKFSLGVKAESYRSNLAENKAELAETFINNCDGNKYLTQNTKIIKISAACDELQSAHDGWDNYYHEPQYAKDIMSFFVTAEDIPKEIERKIIDIFLDCRIGREVRYNSGVSPSAKEYYNEFFKMLNKEQIIMTIRLMKKHFDGIYSENGIQAQNAKEIVELMKSPVLGERLNEILDYMISFASKGILTKVHKDHGFKTLCQGIILNRN